MSYDEHLKYNRLKQYVFKFDEEKLNLNIKYIFLFILLRKMLYPSVNSAEKLTDSVIM